jgi:hypothetical protein
MAGNIICSPTKHLSIWRPFPGVTFRLFPYGIAAAKMQSHILWKSVIAISPGRISCMILHDTQLLLQTPLTKAQSPVGSARKLVFLEIVNVPQTWRSLYIAVSIHENSGDAETVTKTRSSPRLFSAIRPYYMKKVPRFWHLFPVAGLSSWTLRISRRNTNTIRWGPGILGRARVFRCWMLSQSTESLCWLPGCLLLGGILCKWSLLVTANFHFDFQTATVALFRGDNCNRAEIMQ